MYVKIIKKVYLHILYACKLFYKRGKSVMNTNQLLKNIEEYRAMMIVLANTTSLSHPKVVDISTKLDNLLNKYDTLRTK